MLFPEDVPHPAAGDDLQAASTHPHSEGNFCKTSVFLRLLANLSILDLKYLGLGLHGHLKTNLTVRLCVPLFGTIPTMKSGPGIAQETVWRCGVP